MRLVTMREKQIFARPIGIQKENQANNISKKCQNVKQCIGFFCSKLKLNNL